MKKITWATSLCLFFAAPVVLAEGLSLGASYGFANIDDSEAGFSLDASDTGYKLFGRYMFRNGFGIEGGYIDFGNPDDDFLGQTAQIDAEAWNLYGVGTLGLSENFDLFAKAGFISWEADSFLNGIPVGTDDGEDLALGIGAKFGSESGLGFRAEFEWFDVDDVDAVWMASVGLEFRF
ncbi:MAG: outer membrane beta-barrel protein [Woeseiaceae bacterium]|nr:outer membrane beta-barrel protein [Woeseiaceae bacterium]